MFYKHNVLGVLVCNDFVCLDSRHMEKLKKKDINVAQWRAEYAHHDGDVNRHVDLLLENGHLGQHVTQPPMMLDSDHLMQSVTSARAEGVKEGIEHGSIALASAYKEANEWREKYCTAMDALGGNSDDRKQQANHLIKLWMNKHVEQTGGLPRLIGRKGVVKEGFFDEKNCLQLRVQTSPDYDWWCPAKYLEVI